MALLILSKIGGKMGKENLVLFLEFIEENYGKLSSEMIEYIKKLQIGNLKVNYQYLLEMFESEKISKIIEKAHLHREVKGMEQLSRNDLIKYDINIALRKYPRYSKYKSLKKNPLCGITDEHKEVAQNRKLYPKLSRENMDLIEEKKGGYDDFIL